MRSKTVFTGQHDGFHYEVQNWGFTEEEKKNWCGYVYFTPLNTPKDLRDKLISLPVAKHGVAYSDSWVASLDWHGGITYASFEFNDKGEVVAFKAGCDYQHYWDEGSRYDAEYVERDCIQTIESFKEMVNITAN